MSHSSDLLRKAQNAWRGAAADLSQDPVLQQAREMARQASSREQLVETVKNHERGGHSR